MATVRVRSSLRLWFDLQGLGGLLVDQVIHLVGVDLAGLRGAVSGSALNSTRRQQMTRRSARKYNEYMHTHSRLSDVLSVARGGADHPTEEATEHLLLGLVQALAPFTDLDKLRNVPYQSQWPWATAASGGG